MQPRHIIVQKRPSLALVPQYFLRGMENDDSAEELLKQTREYLCSLDENYRQAEHLTLYSKCLYSCYLELYNASRGKRLQRKPETLRF